MSDTNHSTSPSEDKPSVKLQVLVGFLILSAIANIALAYLLIQKTETIEQIVVQNDGLTNDKDQLETELESMLAQYDNLKEENGELSDELTAEQEKVKELIEKVKNGNWTIYKLKKEAETLRGIMKGFVRTIDSLNTANIKLIGEKQAISQKYDKEKQRSNQLNEKANELEQTVKKGQQLTAASILVEGLKMKWNNTYKAIENADKVDKLKSCVTIAENRIAPAGNRYVYVRVVSPSGKVLSEDQSESKMFNYEGVRGLYTVKKAIKYENKDLEVCLYWEPNTPLTPGTYIFHIYSDGVEIGKANLELN